MKKIILCSILAIIIFSSIGCNGNKTVLNDKADKNGNNDTKISFESKQETKEKIDTYISAECTWAYDVTNPETVLENTDYLVKVQVKTKEKTKYFVKNTIMPNSTYNVKVLDIISPENATLPQNIKIAVSGGVVSMEEYVNTLDLETKEKNKKQINFLKKICKKLVMISSESYYELEQGNEYYILYS